MIKKINKYIIIIYMLLLINCIYGQKNTAIYNSILKDDQNLLDSIFIKYTTLNTYYFTYRYNTYSSLQIDHVNDNDVNLDSIHRLLQIIDSMKNNAEENIPISFTLIQKPFFEITYLSSRLITSIDTIDQFINYINIFYIDKTESIDFGFKDTDLILCGDFPFILVEGYKDGNEVFKKHGLILKPNIIFNPKFKEFSNFLENLTESLAEEKR